jgi:hypothetical protein
MIGLTVIFLAAAALAPGQEWNRAVSTGLTAEPVAGLLNLPEVTGGGCGPDEPGSVALYEAQSTAGVPIGSIQLRVTDRQPGGGSCGSATVVVRRAAGNAEEQLPTDESGYEIPAAVVYQQSGLWFRIALQRGSAWVKRESLEDFQPYPELTRDSGYLRDDWDGRLWRTPAAGASARVPPAWTKYLGRSIAIDILDVRRLENATWVRVRLRTETCGETKTDVTPATGWIPAYRSSGQTGIWFYSRGC